MKERLQGLTAGVLIGTLLTGVAVFAKTAMENIEVMYDNIKVYKDNVLCELKDANGSVIEPFIYNGTTYMPVRGTASLADMQVTWDGNSKSVYLWDNMVPDGTYLMEVCPPYETDDCGVCISSKGDVFQMDGKTYSNGLTLRRYSSNALFNLDGKYKELSFDIGHVRYLDEEKTISFVVDGNTVKTVTLAPEQLAEHVIIPLNYGLQMKIVFNGLHESDQVGIANMIVK